MASKTTAPEAPYELELLRVGPVRCNPVRDWEVGGDFGTVEEAERSLRGQVRERPIYQQARVRQYRDQRSAATTVMNWRVQGTRIRAD